SRQSIEPAAVARQSRAHQLHGGMVSGLQAAAVGSQTGAYVELPDARFQAAARPLARLDGGADALPQAVPVLVGLLESAADAPVQDAEPAVDALLPQAALQHRQTVAHGLRDL